MGEMDPQPADRPGEHPDPNMPRRWLDRHLWQIQPVRDLMVIAAVVGFFWLGYKLSVVTVPLLLAIMLAYIFEPLVKRMTQAAWMSRQGAAAAIIALTAAVVVIPLALGLSFAAIQGIQLAGDLATQTAAIKAAIDNPDDEMIQGRVQGRIPEWIRDAILDARDNEQKALDDFKDLHGPVREDGTPVSDPPADESGPKQFEPGATDQPNPATTADTDDPAETEIQSAPDTAASPDDQPDPSPELSEAKKLDRARRLPDDDFTETMQLVLSWVERNATAVSQRALQTGATAFDAFLRTVTSVFYITFTLFLTAFFFFFISSGWNQFITFSSKFIPDEHHDFTVHLLHRFDRAVSGFIRGRLTIAFIQSIVFSLGYWIIGVPAPVLLGVAVAVLSIVPYAALVGIPVSIGLLWLEDRTGIRGSILWTLGAPVAFYFIGQALDDYVWTPLIQGKSTGMDTPTILFATLAGGALMGVYGLLLAIPLAACIKILLEEVFWPRFQDWIAGKRPDFLPIDKS